MTTLVMGSELDTADALIEGSLTLTENGCLAVRDPTGIESVLAWPAGVELLTGDNDAGVRVPDVGDIMIGDDFSAGGSYSPATRDGNDQMPEAPSRCLDTPDVEIAIIQHKSSIDL